MIIDRVSCFFIGLFLRDFAYVGNIIELLEDNKRNELFDLINT